MTGSRLLRVLIAILVLGAIGFVFVSGLWKAVSPRQLAQHQTALFGFVAAHPLEATGLFALVCVAVAAACVPGPGVVAVLGGALLGGLVGGLAALIGFTVGSTVTFLAFRAASGDWILSRGGSRLAELSRRLSRDAFPALLAVRLLPIAPMGAITLAAAVAQLRIAPFAAATFLGAAPATLIYAFLGAGISGRLRAGAPISPALLASPSIVAPLGLLALLAGAAAIVRLRRP